MPSGSFTISAVIEDADLWKHYRDRDHKGTEDDTTVVAESSFSWYAPGTTLAVILADLWERTDDLP